MKKEIRTLVLYRLNRADESLEEALILLGVKKGDRRDACPTEEFVGLLPNSLPLRGGE
jgi:hypothetical protein